MWGMRGGRVRNLNTPYYCIKVLCICLSFLIHWLQPRCLMFRSCDPYLYFHSAHTQKISYYGFTVEALCNYIVQQHSCPHPPVSRGGISLSQNVSDENSLSFPIFSIHIKHIGGNVIFPSLVIILKACKKKKTTTKKPPITDGIMFIRRSKDSFCKQRMLENSHMITMFYVVLCLR